MEGCGQITQGHLAKHIDRTLQRHSNLLLQNRNGEQSEYDRHYEEDNRQRSLKARGLYNSIQFALEVLLANGFIQVFH